jgi:hypothetical protein
MLSVKPAYASYVSRAAALNNLLPQRWRHSHNSQHNDGLQLNPPKLRPLTKQQQQQQQQNDSLLLDWRSFRAKLIQLEQRGLLNPSSSLTPKPAAPGRGSGLGAFAFSSGGWAHELPGPEVGCVLVARQEGMQFFDRTVVLLAAHGERVSIVFAFKCVVFGLGWMCCSAGS